MSKANDTAAAIFQGAATSASSLVDVVGNPAAATALRAGAGIAGLIAVMIRAGGVDSVRDLLVDAAEKQREAMITAGDLADDDAKIARAVLAMYPPAGDEE